MMNASQKTKSSFTGTRIRSCFKLAATLTSTLHLISCAPNGMFSDQEKSGIANGNTTVVLLRIASCDIENQQTFKPFENTLADDNISFGIGTFATGGEPVRYGGQRFPSPESRRQGWMYLVVPRATCYLAVYPPRRTGVFAYEDSLKQAARWQVDIPESASIVYAGSLHLTGKSDWLIGGGRIMNSIDQAAIRVTNEQKLADQIASTHFPQLGRAHRCLMRRHSGGPILLRSPVSNR